MAIVGRVPGTEHFRNIDRHDVRTDAHILALRVDESLYFANARYLEERIANEISGKPEVTEVILMCPAINAIDMSALESLEAINIRLKEQGIGLNLSEVKGPVMDRLKRTDFLDHLNGRVFLSHHDAVAALSANPAP
jgi:SulP family sulfate permease